MIAVSVLFANVFDHVLHEQEDEPLELSPHMSSSEVFELVVHHYIDVLYRYINYRFGLQKSATEDIVQEIFLKLPKKLRRYDSSRALEPWLFTVAHRVALDYIKKHNNHKHRNVYIDMQATEDFLYTISTSQEELPDNLEKAYHEGLLRFLLDKLDDRNKQLLLLFYFEHKSYDEIAHIIGVKTS